MRRIYGETARFDGDIKHYGVVTPVFDLHPGQVQPSHIVVTSPWFDTREMHFGYGGRMRGMDRERIRQRIIELSEWGMMKKDIAEALEVSASHVGRVLAQVDGEGVHENKMGR